MTAPLRAPRLVHSIRVEHAVTHETIGAVRARLEDPVWPGWILQHRPSHVLLIAEEGSGDEPASTALSLRIENPQLVHCLARDPGSTDDTVSDGKTVRVSLARPTSPIGKLAETVVPVDPAPMKLELELVDELDRPLAGVSVAAHGTDDAPAIPLTAVPDVSGGAALVRSEWQVWDDRYYPFSITVAGTRVASRCMRYSERVTRFRLVVPSHMREED